MRSEPNKPDAVIRVRFRRTDEGGKGHAPSGKFYACIFVLGSDGFDGRLLLNGRTLELGVEHEVGVKFLSPDLVLPRLSPGTKIALREGREIAEGTVLRLA